jgi:hypothetical protein
MQTVPSRSRFTQVKKARIVSAVLVACAPACGSGAPPSEAIGVTSSAIQDGTVDSTHKFVVGVVQVDQNAQTVQICSGSLLAPNLVVTARHCVAALNSPAITCGSSSFGGLAPVGDFYVSDETEIESVFTRVAPGGIIVPQGAGDASVCGNDIALLILQNNINLSAGATNFADYVVPAISPPMTDSSYSTNVTAIGYGINTPTDEAGTSAGVRRIKESVQLACIPGDTVLPALDCLTGAGAASAEQVLTSNEFISGNASTCEGDSGSGAYDQGYFDKGQWVSFGVLSRGSVSPDGQTCIQPIYTRFDAWGDLLISAAKQAQAAANPTYSLPTWAQGQSVTEIFAVTSTPAATSSAPPAGTAQQCRGTGAVVAGASCACANDCASNECVTADGTNYVCANPCNAGACGSGFTCLGSGNNSYCFADSVATALTPPAKSSGCSAAPYETRDGSGRYAWGCQASLCVGLVFLRRSLRRRRRTAKRKQHLAGSRLYEQLSGSRHPRAS